MYLNGFVSVAGEAQRVGTPVAIKMHKLLNCSNDPKGCVDI